MAQTSQNVGLVCLHHEFRFIHEGSKREKKELSNKAWLIYQDGHWIWTRQSDKKVKTKNWHEEFLFWCFFFFCFFNVSYFRTLLFFRHVTRDSDTWLLTFLTCCALKTWFELSRVELCIQMIWRETKLLWVTVGKITVHVWKKSRGNRFWFELAWGSSYRESTVLKKVSITFAFFHNA